MELDEALAICAQFPALLVKEVDFTGGEPLLSPLLLPLVERLAEFGITCRIVTNGTLLEEMSPALAAAGVASIAVSVDGLPATHDEIRAGKGLYVRVANGIHAAQKEGVVVTAITAVSDRNVDELLSLKEALSNMGIAQWQVQPLFARGRARYQHLSLSEHTYERLCNFVAAENAGPSSLGMRVVAADGIGYLCPSDTRRSAWRGCFAGIVSCGITSDGKVKGCLSLPDETVEGDLRQADLWDIWFSRDAFKYNRDFVRTDLGSYCALCSAGETCKGGCSVMSWAATGSYHNDPYCMRGIEARRQAVTGRSQGS